MLLRVTQLFYIFFPKLFMRCAVRMRVAGRENFERVKPPVIIIANHQSTLDVLVLIAALPMLSKLLPVRFIGWRGLYRIPLLYVILRTSGVIPVEHGGQRTLEEKLAPAVCALRRGESVVLFPEGKRYPISQFGEVHPVGRGAAYLQRAARVPVLPAIIKWNTQPSLRAFFLRKIHAVISLGEAIDDIAFPRGAKLEDFASFLFEKVRKLGQGIEVI